MRERHFDALMAAPLTGGCDFCDWHMEGTSGEVLKAQLAHRASHGMEKWSFKRSSVRNLTHFRQANIGDDEWSEINAVISQRKKLHGIEEAA